MLMHPFDRVNSVFESSNWYWMVHQMCLFTVQWLIYQSGMLLNSVKLESMVYLQISMHKEEGIFRETGMVVLLRALHVIFGMDGKSTLNLTLCLLLSQIVVKINHFLVTAHNRCMWELLMACSWLLFKHATNFCQCDINNNLWLIKNTCLPMTLSRSLNCCVIVLRGPACCIQMPQYVIKYNGVFLLLPGMAFLLYVCIYIHVKYMHILRLHSGTHSI